MKLMINLPDKDYCWLMQQTTAHLHQSKYTDYLTAVQNGIPTKTTLFNTIKDEISRYSADHYGCVSEYAILEIIKKYLK